jgi:hypothetical protein
MVTVGANFADANPAFPLAGMPIVLNNSVWPLACIQQSGVGMLLPLFFCLTVE